MKHHIRNILIALAAGIVVQTAFAQQSIVRLSLDECINIALDDNIAYKRAKIAVSQSQIIERTAFDVPQTALSLVQTATDGGGPDNGVKLSQEFDFPTVYAAKRKYLKSETALERSKAEMTKSDLVAEISSLYYSLLYRKEICAIVAAQDTLYERFCSVAKARYDEGESSKIEWLNARRLMSENKLAIEQAQVERKALMLQLQALLNVDYAVEPLEDALVPIDDAAYGDTVDFASTPEGMIADGRLQVALQNERLAKQGFMPTLSVGATTQLLIKGFNPYDIDRRRFEKGDFVGFEVGVSVPLFFGSQKAKVRAATQAVKAEELKKVEQERKQETELQILGEDYVAALRTLRYYRRTGLPEAEEMLRLSLVSYELGEIGYEEHARNLENIISVKRTYSEALEKYNQTILKLKRIKGQL
ncbi:MAG: TolC family protein [Prevotellaceae bacterium]|nr:TolC family protein [Prevotellaceae bacterium]